MKVLIIDDNPKMRTFIRQVLTETSTEIYECTDGQWALQAYREYRPDWVFMDIKMNLKDGITATREIHEEFPEAKIIIVTEYSDDVFRKEAKVAGAIDYVLKEHLLTIVPKLTGQRT